jgi:4-cresol dehydrogenase (hydroxylating)
MSPVIDALRELALRGAVDDDCVSLWNGYKVGSVLGEPLRRPPSAWSLAGAVYAPSESVGQSVCELIEATLGPTVDALTFVADEQIPAEARDAFLGRPTGRATRSVYAKLGGLAARNTPEADGCGVLWVCPQLPLAGSAAVKALSLVERTTLERGFEPNIGLKLASPRTLRAFVQLLYDRRERALDERALELHDALHDALNGLGHAPYRLGLASMSSIPPFCDDHASLFRRLTACLDPDGILAPGRYDFGSRG